MQTIALYNLKGGVGKTTAAVNLAYLASAEGNRTLLFDMDPQGSASYYYRVRPAGKLKAKTVAGGGKKLERGIRGSDYANLDILPADISYRHLSRNLGKKKRPRRRLAEVFSRFETEFDYLFIDCPPGISLEAESVFRAADMVLMPVIPTPLSMQTKGVVYRFFEEKGLSTSLIVPFFSLVDRRKSLHRTIVLSTLKRDESVLRSYIPYSSSIERMGISRKPVCSVSSRSVGAVTFAALWEETKTRLRSR